MFKNAKRLIVKAEVRYWEDATVNGVTDDDGSLIPFRMAACWRPVIDLATGQVIDWPVGTTADIHYKVCDAGEYWLADENNVPLAKYGNDLTDTSYVPDELLCIGDRGYGDYIIMTVDASGIIQGWKQPRINSSAWTTMPSGDTDGR